ncbi:MAG: hypothetical protein RXR07_07385 [Sulfolobaceae archaeon]
MYVPDQLVQAKPHMERRVMEPGHTSALVKRNYLVSIMMSLSCSP